MAVGEPAFAVEVWPDMLVPQALKNSRQAKSTLAKDNVYLR